MRCSNHVTTDAHLKVELDFSPDKLARFEKLLKAMLRETSRALRLSKHIDAERAAEVAELEAFRQEYKAQVRLVVSVWHRTGDAHLAAQAGRLAIGHARLIIADCEGLARRAVLLSRDQLIVMALDRGEPVKVVAERHQLHPKSLPRIVRKAREAGIVPRPRATGTRKAANAA